MFLIHNCSQHFCSVKLRLGRTKSGVWFTSLSRRATTTHGTPNIPNPEHFLSFFLYFKTLYFYPFPNPEHFLSICFYILKHYIFTHLTVPILLFCNQSVFLSFIWHCALHWLHRYRFSMTIVNYYYESRKLT